MPKVPREKKFGKTFKKAMRPSEMREREAREAAAVDELVSGMAGLSVAPASPLKAEDLDKSITTPLRPARPDDEMPVMPAAPSRPRGIGGAAGGAAGGITAPFGAVGGGFGGLPFMRHRRIKPPTPPFMGGMGAGLNNSTKSPPN